MRPDHPLPPPVHIEPVAGPSEPKNDMKATTKASKKAEKAAKKAEKAAKKSNKNKAAAKEVEVSLSPPSRARMVKIDPTQWQAKHLREPDLQNLPDTSTVRTKAVKPVTTSKAVKPDSVKQAVQAQVQAPVSSEEEDSSESDGDDGSSKGTSIVPAKAKEASTTASKAVEAVYDEKASIAERKANLDLVAQLLGGLPKSLAPVQDTIMAQGDASDTDEDSDAEDLEEDLELHQEGEGHQSTSAIEQTSESSVNTEGKDESSSDSDVVNEGTRQILDATLVPEPSADSHMAAGKRDTGSSTNLQPLREADQLSQSAEPESEMETEDALGPASEPVALAEVQMQSLTDMFKPQEAAGKFFNISA